MSRPWYHLTSPPRLRGRPLLHGPVPLSRFTERCIGPLTGAARPDKGHPSPPTVPGRFFAFPGGSERGSEVLFASVSGPASQLPRFSDPFRLGTRPHHRRLHLNCRVDPITAR